MAKGDQDLFDRLRRAGVRKQVAKTLSELGEGAGKKAAAAARSTAGELRALADEIERRLPSAEPASRTTRRGTSSAKPAAPKPATPTAAPRTPASRTAAATKPATRTAAPKKPATRSTAAKPASRTGTGAARTRGATKPQ